MVSPNFSVDGEGRGRGRGRGRGDRGRGGRGGRPFDRHSATGKTCVDAAALPHHSSNLSLQRFRKEVASRMGRR